MSGVSSAECRSHHHALPWMSLVPPFVFTLTVEPMVCPSEASNAVVSTLNSEIEACGGENATRTLRLSENVFVTPSIVNSLP